MQDLMFVHVLQAKSNLSFQTTKSHAVIAGGKSGLLYLCEPVKDQILWETRLFTPDLKCLRYAFLFMNHVVQIPVVGEVHYYTQRTSSTTTRQLGASDEALVS